MCTMICIKTDHLMHIMSLHKLIQLCFLLLSICTSQWSFADEVLSRIISNQRIVIAHRELSRPFSYLDKYNKPIGFAMDICGKIVERIQSELKLPQLNVSYLLVNTNNHVKVIKEGKADIECGTTPITSTPNEQVDFSIPYFYSSTRMMVHANSSIKEWTDLRHQKITFVNGSNSIQLIRKYTAASVKDMRLIGEISPRVAFDNLTSNQASAFIADELSLYILKAGNPKPEQFVITASAIGTEALAIMMPSNSPQLKKLMNTVIADLMTSGKFNQLYDKWFMQAIPPHQINYQFPMNALLRDSIRFPSHK
jgi:ABC-type amino acid transport substrate-binding protein